MVYAVLKTNVASNRRTKGHNICDYYQHLKVLVMTAFRVVGDELAEGISSELSLSICESLNSEYSTESSKCR